jgi:beta-galactosidase
MENTKNKKSNHPKLRIIYGDCTLGVSGDSFHYIFSYMRGGLESLNVNGIEWMYRVPKPTFWRATTDNDRGNNFSVNSHMWLGADLYAKHVAITVKVDGEEIELPITPANNIYTNQEYADSIEVKFIYNTGTTPNTRTEIAYLVEKCGKIKISTLYKGEKGLPDLPLFGIRFIMPTVACGYRYEGLSGETYPDRMAGGIEGVYEVAGLPVTPHLVPQDCGVHMKTKWLEITRDSTLSNIGVRNLLAPDKLVQKSTLKFQEIDGTFIFSCLPYTALELENATHQEDLPMPRRTVLSILAKARGVGGINSWGANVEDEFRISGEEDYKVSFAIIPEV